MQKLLLRMLQLVLLAALFSCQADFQENLIHWSVKEIRSAQVPMNCRNGFSPVILPGSLEGQSGLVAEGHYWLCTEFSLPESTPPLTFVPGLMAGEMKIYLNGVLLSDLTTELADPEKWAYSMRRFSVDLPAGLLQSSNLLVIEYTGHNVGERSGMYAGIPVIVDRSDDRFSILRIRTIHFSMLVFIFLMGLIFLFSYIRHYRAYEYLFLSLYFLIGALYAFFRQEAAFNPPDDVEAMFFRYRLIFALPFLMLLNFVHFLYHHTRGRVFHLMLFPLDFLTVIVVILTLISKSVAEIYGQLQILSPFVFILYFSFMVFVLLRDAYQGIERSLRLILLVVIVSILSAFDLGNEIYHFLPDMVDYNLTLYATLIVAIFISVLLFSKYRAFLEQYGEGELLDPVYEQMHTQIAAREGTFGEENAKEKNI